MNDIRRAAVTEVLAIVLIFGALSGALVLAALLNGSWTMGITAMGLLLIGGLIALERYNRLVRGT